MKISHFLNLQFVLIRVATSLYFTPSFKILLRITLFLSPNLFYLAEILCVCFSFVLLIQSITRHVIRVNVMYSVK